METRTATVNHKHHHNQQQRQHYSSPRHQPPSHYQQSNNNNGHYQRSNNDHGGHYHVPSAHQNGRGSGNQQHGLFLHNQHYHQLPVIVHGQPHHSQQLNGHYQTAATAAGGRRDGSAAAIIVVDPPRPPFIPKKPVYNSCGDPHHSQQHNNQISNANNHHHIEVTEQPFQSTMIISASTAGGADTTYIGSGGGGLRRSTTPLPLGMGVPSEEERQCGAGGHPPQNQNHPHFVSSAENPPEDSNTGGGGSSSSSSFSSVRSVISCSGIIPVVASADEQDGLHYSVTGGVAGSCTNGIYATSAVLPSNNTAQKPPANPKRRPSLLGGVSIKMPESQHHNHQRPPIGNHQGRIYATAGYGAGNTTIKKATNGTTNNNLSSVSSQSSMNLAPKNCIIGGSQLQLNGDGKSTLSRKAQKLAQKAVHKLTIGGSELSNSASALYSMFTSGAETQNGTNGGGGGIYAETSSLYNLGFNQPQIFYGDKTPVVSAHTSRGIEFLERFGQFIKERALIEEEYAAKLKSLAKRSRGKKNDDEDAKMYTTASAFQAMLSEMESFASQHEVIGERLRGELLPQIMEKGRQLRAGRKKHSQDFEMMEKCLQARVDELCKQRKNYEKSHLDAQGAHVKYAKAEKNMNLTRIHLANAKQSMHDKNAVCEQNKQAYAAQVATTNQAKFDHFNVALPRLLEEMRMLDIERIQFTKQAMLDSVKVETGVLNIIQRCYADMNSAIATIDPDRDTTVVVEQTKTGYAHPHDFQFEDLGDPADILKDGSESFDGSTMKRASNGKGVGRKHSMKLFNSAAAAAKVQAILNLSPRSNGTAGSHGSVSSAGGGAASEYGQLPPQQRCRKIQQKLKELQDDLNIKDQSQAGMQRMHGAYSQNPKLGDPTEVAKQLQQNRQEMDALQQQILRFQNLLTDAQRELNQPLGGAHHHNSQGQLHNTTTSSSSPSSSPRGSAGSTSKLNNGHHPQGAPPNYGQSGRFNGSDPRASYSEASSISSVDAASMHTMNNGPNQSASNTISPPRAAGMVPQHQQQNTASTLSTSGFSTTVTNKSSPSPAQSQSHNQQQQMPHIDSGSADFYEECDTPSASARPKQSDLVLGTALAIYAYDAVPDEVDGTTISMKEGDELLLLERDVGDGWTRVRHVLSNAEGFVPTSYLDCKWYPTDGPPRV